MKRTERKSHEEWLQIISDQEHSGQDLAEYCEQRGLSANRFVFHRRRKSREAHGGGGFREIRLTSNSSLRIVLEQAGCAIEVQSGFDAQLLSQVVKALR